MTDRLFDKIETLQGAGFHPKWKDVVLNAQVPGLTRFRAAQDWLDKARTPVLQAGPVTAASTEDRVFREFLQWRQKKQ